MVSTREVLEAINDRPSNLNDLSVPVFVDRQLPRPDSETPIVIQTVSDASLDILTLNNQVVQLQDTRGFRLSVATLRRDGAMNSVTTLGALSLAHGDSIAVSGGGLAPNSDAVLWLFSQPRRLSVVRVGVDGQFTAQSVIGIDVPVGQHTAQINGLTPQGELRSLNLAVNVVSATYTDLVEQESSASTSTTIATEPRAEQDGNKSLEALLIAIIIILGTSTGLLLIARRRRDRELQ